MGKEALTTLGEDIRKALIRATEEVLGPRARNILWEAEQPSLLDSILADVSDIIPIVGEWFDAARTADAAAKGKPRGARTISLAIGTLPRPIGNIADVLTPIQTITWLEDHGYSVTQFPYVFAKELGVTFPSLEGILKEIVEDAKERMPKV